MTKETRTLLLLVELGFITSPILAPQRACFELAVRSSTTSQCLQRHQDCPCQESDILAKPALRVV